MSDYNPYSVQQLFKYAFGLIDPIYMVGQPASSNSQINYPEIKSVPKEKAKKMSWLGTPIMFPIRFPAGMYKEYDVKGYLKQELTEVKSWDLPATTLVDFTRSKNIVRTEVLGGSGTVKEIYGLDDWQIRMRGVALNEPNLSAREQIDNLLAFEKLADSISLSNVPSGFNELFFDKDIFNIVIKDIDIKQVQAKPGMIPFEISAISDEPIELVIGRGRKGIVSFGELEVVGFDI